MFIKQGKTNIEHLLIVIILAAIIGGGILGWRYWWLPKQEVETPATEVPEKAKAIEDETADWKVYNNQEGYGYKGYAFEIKYPKDWVVSCNAVDFNAGLCSTLFRSPNYKWALVGAVRERTEVEEGASVGLGITKVDPEFTWQWWARRPMGRAAGIISDEEITIAGKSAIQITMRNPNLAPVRKYVWVAIPTPDQEELFEFQLNTVEGEEEVYQTIFNQMLSTFRFVE